MVYYYLLNRLTLGFLRAIIYHHEITMMAKTMQLGDLEKQVLQYFWEVDTANAKQVHAHFQRQRGGSLNTIQSTLDRLFRKGLLQREKVSHAFEYRAALERSAFLSHLVQQVTQDFRQGNENTLLTAFTGQAEQLDTKDLDRLERWLAAQREQQD